MKDAIKWTEERVLETLEDMKHDALREDVEYLGTALVRQDLHKQVWSYWKKKFAGHEEINHRMLSIEQIFEARLVQNALNKKVSPWMAIFALKCNYHWSDKPEAQPTAIERHLPEVKGNENNGMFGAKPEAENAA